MFLLFANLLQNTHTHTPVAVQYSISIIMTNDDRKFGKCKYVTIDQIKVENGTIVHCTHTSFMVGFEISANTADLGHTKYCESHSKRVFLVLYHALFFVHDVWPTSSKCSIAPFAPNSG